MVAPACGGVALRWHAGRHCIPRPTWPQESGQPPGISARVRTGQTMRSNEFGLSALRDDQDRQGLSPLILSATTRERPMLHAAVTLVAFGWSTPHACRCVARCRRACGAVAESLRVALRRRSAHESHLRPRRPPHSCGASSSHAQTATIFERDDVCVSAVTPARRAVTYEHLRGGSDQRRKNRTRAISETGSGRDVATTRRSRPTPAERSSPTASQRQIQGAGRVHRDLGRKRASAWAPGVR